MSGFPSGVPEHRAARGDPVARALRTAVGRPVVNVLTGTRTVTWTATALLEHWLFIIIIYQCTNCFVCKWANLCNKAQIVLTIMPPLCKSSSLSH